MRLYLALACLAALTGTARADYALVVGSNPGGPGQAELKYAEDDARKVGAVLVELGGYAPDQVDIVVHPTPDALRERLGKLGERLAADAKAGRQSRVFFYYSGHARATALDLGPDELPLPELRQRLFALGATLTVVVLDACQSGAFSHVKGAAPAADFSYNSRQHLDAAGVAVLASSSGSELSQESLELHGSYFTHHFLVGLRGAGDANGDGQVSLDEAYQYAYHQTLLATSETAVGGQHVTFEASLKGHGEVALSFPRAATQAIILPARLEGQTLVEDKKAHAVVAETYKAKGAPVRIAVAPGDYEVLVRHGRTLSRCSMAAGGTVDLDHCQDEQIRDEATKGGDDDGPSLWRHGATILLGNDRDDAYTDNLRAFGYQRSLQPSFGVSLSELRQMSPELSLGGFMNATRLPDWSHSVVGTSASQKLQWSTVELGPMVRGQLAFADGGFLGRFHAYGELQLALGLGRSELTGTDGMTYSKVDFGYAFGAGAGIHMHIARDFGASLGYAFDYAPIISDLIGNTHTSGGNRLTLGVTYGN